MYIVFFSAWNIHFYFLFLISKRFKILKVFINFFKGYLLLSFCEVLKVITLQHFNTLLLVFFHYHVIFNDAKLCPLYALVIYRAGHSVILRINGPMTRRLNKHAGCWVLNIWRRRKSIHWTLVLSLSCFNFVISTITTTPKLDNNKPTWPLTTIPI